ncbi:hypothetical protein PHSY_004022 [Pseudozyma hubeiensis SY62]|uniref:Uncharacterized protein n=1 Tax=Pseudozyma hubeiensis (strain SY62) TaxID=1305764 RepID=R9P5E0_PSEHS|nr:hypothetical protein PHSY_004022 [Pseudozyma hubeiensis SY62]GAC96442.1 hypothetical protein PHSY_004022 [Pseudozyma hubeiensis SY62]
MGVSSTARLPSLGAQSIPPLFSHLQHSSNAKVVARWSITIRSFRAVPVPTNAWPSPNQYDSNFSLTSLDDDPSSSNVPNAASASTSSAAAGGSTLGLGGGAGSSASGAPPLTKPRTMWQVQLSDHPGVVFVVVEDTGRASRAKVWRDWELSTKKWRKQKRREIAARRKKEEQTEAEKPTMQGENGNSIVAEERADKIETEASGVPMDEDAPSSLDPQGDARIDAVSTESQLPSGPSADSQPSEAPAPAGEQTEQESVEPAGPKPKLRLPSHTRYTVSAITSSMAAMLSGLNLPPPHGAPVGTAGPGAWVPRGAAVSIEGLVLEINSQSLNALPGISPALASLSNTDDAGVAGSSGGVDWRVRVGSVVGGGRRSAGAIVEAEFLPASTISPTSKFMNDFLFSLFPAGLVPAQPSAPVAAVGMPNVTGNAGAPQAGSGMAVPGVNNPSLGLASATNGNITGAVGGASGTEFSYTIGGGAGATPPNRNLNLPVVSDQLWEEVVPRSGEGWVRRISKRSRKMAIAARTLRRQRKNAGESSSGPNGRMAEVKDAQTDAFGWHMFGSDDEADPKATAPINGHSLDEDNESLYSSDSEVEATPDSASNAVACAGGLTGTAVTMQQGDQGEDDDDEDDDRPLGAPAWSSSNRPAAAASTPNVVPPAAVAPSVAKKEHTVQLIFQGLQSDADDTEGAEDGWSGIERGRRIAFQYVQMLRAEGII